VKECKVCQRSLYEIPLLEFRDMPAVAQNFPDKADLDSDRGVSFDVKQCSGCGLIQLTSPPVPYHRDVIRAAAYSPGMLQFRRKQFSEFLEKSNTRGARLLEVGCGRGEYLSLMQEAGANVSGLEHCWSSVEACQKNGLDVMEGYIESGDYKIRGAPFDGFFIMSFLEHIPDINSFLRGIAGNLVEGGIGLVEVPNFDMILRERLISEFMTDHLYYFTEDTLRTALNLNGFDVISCREIWHNYILSAVVTKKRKVSFAPFHEPVKTIRQSLDSFLAMFPEKTAAIWGAGHQALAAISLYSLKDRIAYVVDSAPFKQGKFTPATHLPIRSPEYLKADPEIRAVIVMGAGYSDEIVERVEKDFSNALSIAVLRSEKIEVLRTL